MSRSLFHFSEEPHIQKFDPRPSKNETGEIVWAVDAIHAVNLMLPRDCPRVTFAPNATSAQTDIERLMGYPAARRVIVVESAWLSHIQSCKLFEYAMPAETFVLEDIHAGYYISRSANERLVTCWVSWHNAMSNCASRPRYGGCGMRWPTRHWNFRSAECVMRNHP